MLQTRQNKYFKAKVLTIGSVRIFIIPIIHYISCKEILFFYMEKKFLLEDFNFNLEFSNTNMVVWPFKSLWVQE